MRLKVSKIRVSAHKMSTLSLVQIKRALTHLPRTSFGVSVPELRKLARQIARTDYPSFIEQNPNNTFELRLLHAFVLGYAKDDLHTLLRYFQAFVPLANRWELTDSLCQNFTIARKYPQEVWDFILRYKKSKKEFESRIVAVMLLSHYLIDAYIDRVLAVLNQLNTDDYYSQMGVAWALATVVGKYPQKGLAFLRSRACSLDTPTRQKTIRKIRESFRVAQEIKEQLSEL